MRPPGFTGGTLDRADHLRQDPAALAGVRADARARLLRLDAAEPEVNEDGRLVWAPLSEAPDRAELMLLGLDGEARPHFAARLPDDPPAAGRSPALIAMLDAMRAEDAAHYAAARSLIDWHARHGFCANCGARTSPHRAGWARHCDGCGAEHFPRVDPVVIMIAEHDGRALLGRQPAWPQGRYSALAGFLEVGEAIEEAVAREIAEEAGVPVRGVRYVASQPWPFPSSLMIACIAEATDDTITVDENELESARWFTREDVRAALAGNPAAPFLPPPPYAIAHTLMHAWADG
ncbi:NAD(+) diphosphatase [Stakelama saccharophila]|uniref:NAD(+) diphosphatase n=1 Tax=Stakelama saccharophila TaxID=3075605 RepID=A0ABZ0B9P9_9SPHN|nr:NAD(+) diphosphatase [Stakelama sp. W311]WNO53942.1 NAD(+) diphosphatase [Stakelama sp. W311]